MNHLLDRVFDEFGLILCGWSGGWDTALRAAIERCQTHRFTTYWAARGEPGELANRIIQLRRAVVVPIRDADTFFQELAEKVSSLEDLAKSHPLSAKVAIASLKRYLPDERHRIRLHDLVMQEAGKLRANLSDESFPINIPVTTDELKSRVQRYETLTEILLNLMINGCYWGDSAHERLWTKCIELIANPSGHTRVSNAWVALKRYPALLLFYGGGIASIINENYGLFSALLTKASVRGLGRDHPLIFRVYPSSVMSQQGGKLFFGAPRYTPLNDHMFALLREPLREILPQDNQYQDCFDRFEYLLALVHCDLLEKQGGNIWGPVGCFGWRYELDRENSIMTKIETELTEQGEEWLPLKVGLFDGSLERLRQLKAEYDSSISQLGWW